MARTVQPFFLLSLDLKHLKYPCGGSSGNRARQRSSSRRWEVRSGKLEVKSGKWEVGSRKSEIESGKLEVRSRNWELEGQKSNHAALSLNGQKSEIRSSKFVESEV